MQVAGNSKQIALIRFELPGERFESRGQRFQALGKRFDRPDFRFTRNRNGRTLCVRRRQHSREIAGNLSRRARNLKQIALIRFQTRKFRFKT